MSINEKYANVWIGCLASYNNQKLVGSWVDAGEREEIDAAIAALPGEEWAIFDYENLPNMGMHPDLDELVTVADALWEHGRPFRLWLEAICPAGIPSDPSGAFEDAYQGEWDSPEDFAYDLARDCAEIPEEWANFIDWGAYWESIAPDFLVIRDGSSCVIFWKH